MEAIYGTGIDTRGAEPRLFVSGTSEHWGPGVYYSDDRGVTWTETQGAAVRFPQEFGAVSSGSGKSSRAVREILT